VRWLVEQFSVRQAAKLLDARMTRFQLSDVLRRTQVGDGSSGERKRRQVGGPDAVFSGHLQIDDPVAFAALVARGVGRHRAFGFGMLLLKPPARLD
jgi:CRISPR system Cascade subunit CasE